MTKEHLMVWIASDYIRNIDRQFGEVFITAGAGDIDLLVAPIKNMLNQVN
jgi:UDP-N-acetylmuramate--alanine ligase